MDAARINDLLVSVFPCPLYGQRLDPITGPNKSRGNSPAPASGPATAPEFAGHSFRESIPRSAGRPTLRARIRERPEAIFARAWGNADREDPRIAPWPF